MAAELGDRCVVKAGRKIQDWKGELTPSQCERLPPGGLLGQGAFAAAYQHATDPDKVVKFTADREDALTSSKLIGKNLAQSVRVFDVLNLKGQKATAPVLKKTGKTEFDIKKGQAVFGIVTERLGSLNNYQKAAIRTFDKLYRKREPGGYGVNEIARQANPATFAIKDYVNPTEVERGCFSDVSFDIDEFDDEAIEKAKGYCRRYTGEIFSAVDEVAHKIGVIASDLHDGNWGVKRDTSKLAILDHGISAGKGGIPKITLLAGVRRFTKTARKGRRKA